MRLFVAIEVPSSLNGAIDRDVVELLRGSVEGARWTLPGTRHLTLEFLGEVVDDDVHLIGQALAPAVGAHRPFAAAFEGLGGFPNLRRPRVLWVGVGRGAPELSSVALAVRGALASLGISDREERERPYHPHLTLARFRSPQSVGELPDVVVPSTPFTVEEVVLFGSQLHPKGARYTALERFPLRG